MHPLPKIEQAPRAEQQHDRHADRQDTRGFQRRRDPAVQPFLQFGVVALGFRRQGDGFRNPARQNTGDQRGGADNGQAAQRRAHHKFQAVAGVEQGEEKQHDKIGAGQPVPDQRKGADKQAKEGQRAVGEMDESLGNQFLIVKYQIQRPERNAQHNHHVGQRAKLYVDLVGDNRHRDDEPVANQAAQRAEAQVPVFRRFIAEVERA